MAIYRMLKSVGKLMPGDAVLSDQRLHWVLMRLATPKHPHWFVGPAPHEKIFYGPFLFSPKHSRWVEDGIAVEMTEQELEPYKPHYTAKMKEILLAGKVKP